MNPLDRPIGDVPFGSVDSGNATFGYSRWPLCDPGPYLIDGLDGPILCSQDVIKGSARGVPDISLMVLVDELACFAWRAT